jgi:hypothetical protein
MFFTLAGIHRPTAAFASSILSSSREAGRSTISVREEREREREENKKSMSRRERHS